MCDEKNTKPPQTNLKTNWDRTNIDRAHLYPIKNWENQRISHQAQARHRFFRSCVSVSVSEFVYSILRYTQPVRYVIAAAATTTTMTTTTAYGSQRKETKQRPPTEWESVGHTLNQTHTLTRREFENRKTRSSIITIIECAAINWV